jgi:hypothetical protein
VDCRKQEVLVRSLGSDVGCWSYDEIKK